MLFRHVQKRKELYIEITKSFFLDNRFRIHCLLVNYYKSLDKDGHVIYLKGLSKILAPGCRIGILAASGSIFKRLLAAKANTDLGSPLHTQKAIIPFITSKV
jgi:DNA-binding transcriptional MocR family regulator